MAGSRKEYEMLFQLQAQLGGSFNATFSKAQQQLVQMQKDLQALTKTQSDISAYQKQQQAVDATQKKLETLKQQYDNIQKEIQETGTFSSDLENKLLSKQQQIDKTSDALQRQTEKLGQMGNALRDAGVDTDHLAEESARLGSQIDGVKEKQEKAAEGAASFGETSVAAFGAIGDAIAAAGIAKALHEIAEAYLECVKISADFEESMSTVEALSGATSDEMALLTEKAKELGATTKFTAKESADAMGYMAMAGWDANEMLAGMDGVLQLAAASGEDLAMVSDIVTDNLTAFGLKASDTAHFSDVLAAAATNSNTNVSIMGETFKNSASIAGALGYTIDDVAVAIGLMANSGIKGSLAGTALKNTFNGLLEGVTLTGEALGEYDFSAIKADGTMKSFSETINELRGCFGEMTEAERVNNAMAIAGARSYNGLLAIINATDADYTSLAASIRDCSGAAADMAAIKLDNLNGDLTIMNSAWDAVKTTIGEEFNPELRTLVQLGTDVGTLLNDFIAKHPGLVKGVTVFVAVLGAGIAGITGFIAVTKVAIPLIKLLGAAFTGAIPGVGPILLVISAVAALTGVVVGLTNATKSEEAEVRGLTETSRNQYIQIQELNEQYAEACELYGENSDEARYLAWEIDNLSDSYENGKQSLTDYLAECDELKKSLDDSLTANREAFEEIGKGEGTTLALVHKLQELASQTDKTVETQEQMKAIIAELNTQVPDLALSYDAVIGGVTDYAAAIESAVKAQAAMERYEAAQQGMVDALNAQYTAQNKLDELKDQQASAQERLNTAEQEYLDYLSLVTKYDTTGMAAIGALFSSEYKEYKAAEEALSAYDSEITAYQETLDNATKEYQEYSDELVGYIEATQEAESSTEDMAIAVQSAKDRIDELTQAYTDAYNAAYESVTGQYDLWDEAAEVVATSAGTINTNLQNQITYWQEYNDNLSLLRERTADIEGLDEVIASFADGSADSVNAVAGMATATDEDLKDMVKKWQELQSQQDEVADNIAELKTNFTSEMDQIVSNVQADIEAMNLGDEATRAGMATIQSYIDAAYEMLPSVRSAYSNVAAAARSGLGGLSGYTNKSLPGYAGGTDNAERGWAIVGENGPEILWMNGGEAVTPARNVDVEGAAMGAPASSGGGTISVTFQIDGDITSEAVDKLGAYGEEFADHVRSVVEEFQRDAVRGAYK